MKSVKYPCRNCIYFAACGDRNRQQECKGRMTKTDKKKEVDKSNERPNKE